MSAATECAEWVARGRTRQWEGRPVDAMLCFRRAIRADPRAPDPHFNLGDVSWQFGRVQDALAAWREAARLNPAFLPAWQALAEALLATGDAPAARAAAERVLALAAGNTRAGLIAAIARMMGDDAAADPPPASAVVLALDREPALAGVAALSNPLALALDRAPSTPERAVLLERVAQSTELLAVAPLLLVALAVEHAAAATAAPAKASRATLLAAVRSREASASDAEALRRIAAAVARFDRIAADEIAARHGMLCAASMTPPVPLVWPRRTAGAATRVLVLAGGPGDDAAAVDAIAKLASEAFAVTIASMGTPRASLPSGVTQWILPAVPDVAAAKGISALDADVLIDVAGLAAATGPLLAQHAARQSWTIAALPHAMPLVDRAFGDVDALAEALRALHRDRDATGECPLDASAMAALWTESLRAHQQGNRAAAFEGYTRVLELQPGFAPAHYLSGVAHREEGADALARDAFAAALAAAPGYVEARIAAANSAIAAGDLENAVAICDQGLAAGPPDAGLFRTRGRAHLARRDGAAAAESFARALQVDMADGETHYNLGVALQMERHFADAARAYQRALAFRPDLVDAHFNLGVLFQEQGMTDAAVAAFGEVLAADPANVAAYRILGEVLLAAGRIDAYLANFRRFEARCPDALPLAVQALVACQLLGDFAAVEGYLDGLRQERYAVRSEAELVDALEELLYLLLYFDVEPAMLKHFYGMYDTVARHAYGEPVPATASTARRAGRVRIGYLSGDLRNHVMGKMAWAALEHHDKARFELFFYSLSAVDDEWTAKFRGLADHFHLLAHVPEREAAARIAADDLDILVDLSTHTKGARPGILAGKPARVQVTHVASAGAVGLTTIDFKLTDAFADAPGNQAFQLETLLPMDGCVYPYRHIAPAVLHPFHREALGIAANAVAIGAFVSPMKLSRRCLTLWRDVLARLPQARLLFSPVDPALRSAIERLLAAGGIAPERALYIPQGRNDAENQARYALVDFVLDPMPFGGVNGTLEALDMGVPVVTLQGRRHGERTSYSILANLGVTETVAASGTEYADIAVRLATDPVFMRDVRGRIRDGLRKSTLTNMPAHTRSLERALLAALAARAPEALSAAGERADG